MPNTSTISQTTGFLQTRGFRCPNSSVCQTPEQALNLFQEPAIVGRVTLYDCDNNFNEKMCAAMQWLTLTCRNRLAAPTVHVWAQARSQQSGALATMPEERKESGIRGLKYLYTLAQTSCCKGVLLPPKWPPVQSVRLWGRTVLTTAQSF